MIVVFGSVNFDFFFELRDLPEAGRIAKLDAYTFAPGGKGGNQAVAACCAGSSVELIACVGNDPLGSFLVSDLQAKGVGVAGIRKVAAPTGVSPIFRGDGGQQRSVYACGANASILASYVPDPLLVEGNTVMLQGDTPLDQTQILLARARQRNCRTLLNLGPPCPVTDSILQTVDVLVVNEHEAQAVADQRRQNGLEKEGLARAWAKTFGCDVVITLGGEGALAVGSDGLIHRVRPLAIEPVDTVGAGDAFIGFLAAALDQGLNLESALTRANIAGALTCLKLGAQTAMPTKAAVESCLQVGNTK